MDIFEYLHIQDLTTSIVTMFKLGVEKNKNFPLYT